MLGFRWLANPANVAPDDAEYRTLIDRLADIARMPLQDFPKLPTDFAPPNDVLATAVNTWLAAKPDRNTVVVMVHGFNFEVSAFDRGGAPAAAADDPFNGVYAATGTESWQQIVGELDSGGKPTDTTIAFGWDSEYSFFGGHACLDNGYQYAALDVAPTAARALATVLTALENKSLTVDLFAHSLGTRVTCQALRQLVAAGKTHLVRRVVLLEGAEYSVDAYDAVKNLPNTQFFNIGNQDDDWPPRGAFASHPFRYNGTAARRVIAYDGIADLPNLVDLQIDRRDVQEWAAGQGYTLNPGPFTLPDGSVRSEHWAGYLHPGNRAFLHDLLLRPDRSVAWFRDTKAPLGFALSGYGDLSGFAIPSMPPTCAEREKLIRTS